MTNSFNFQKITCSKMFNSLILLSSLVALGFDVIQAEVYIRPKVAFVYGGNGQIGSAIVEMLLTENYKVTILNRGNDYFSSKSNILPKVSYIKCDRFKGLNKYCPEFLNFIANNDRVDAVIDTNAYTTKYMRHSTELFKSVNVGVYVFISPDNVYDVCIKRHYGPSKETDSERPTEKAEYDLYAEVDKYGHYKLLAEEQLISSGLDYLIFRAPDVIGARDTSSKFWIYHLWIKYFEVLATPIHIPYEVKQIVSSYVYLDDFVQAIRKALVKGVKNEVFNVAFKEPITLTTLLLEISNVLDKSISFDNDIPRDESYHLYPSAARGQLDISKAVYLLGYKPTPLTEAIEKTVQFYEKAQYDYPDERHKVVQQLVDHIASDDVKITFKNKVLAEAMSGKHDMLRIEL